MNAEITLDRPYQPLLDWLASQDIEYEIHEHERAFTARATATAEGVDPRTFAKVLAVATQTIAASLSSSMPRTSSICARPAGCSMSRTFDCSTSPS